MTIKVTLVLKWDLTILKVHKSRLSFSSGEKGKARSTSHRQATQIKFSLLNIGVVGRGGVTTHRGLLECLSTISLLPFGRNHPKQFETSWYSLLWQNMFALFGAHRKVSMIHSSEGDGYDEDHGQAKPRDMLVSSWTTQFSNWHPLSWSIIPCHEGAVHDCTGQYVALSNAPAGLCCSHPPRCWSWSTLLADFLRGVMDE